MSRTLELGIVFAVGGTLYTGRVRKSWKIRTFAT